MRKVILHGAMAKKFGREFKLDVVSLADACRALGSQLKGFRQYINDHDFVVYVGAGIKKGLNLDEEMIDFRLPKGDIHILPRLRGAKGGGLGKIIAGILLAVVAWWAAPFIAGLGIAGLTAGNLMIMGAGLALAGLAQMVSPAPEEKNDKAKKGQDSFMLDGVQNNIEQGGPVPLIYGEVMVGSTLISAGLSTVDLPVGTLDLATAEEGGNLTYGPDGRPRSGWTGRVLKKEEE